MSTSNALGCVPFTAHHGIPGILKGVAMVYRYMAAMVTLEYCLATDSICSCLVGGCTFRAPYKLLHVLLH